MSTTTIEMQAPLAEVALTRTTAKGTESQGIRAQLRRVLAGFRLASAERRMRYELAQLDDAILRDIGYAADEIPRVHAAEDFTPRTWIS